MALAAKPTDSFGVKYLSALSVPPALDLPPIAAKAPTPSEGIGATIASMNRHLAGMVLARHRNLPAQHHKHRSSEDDLKTCAGIPCALCGALRQLEKELP